MDEMQTPSGRYGWGRLLWYVLQGTVANSANSANLANTALAAIPANPATKV